MTRVTILRAGGLITGFECKGHSGYAEEGKDIVCAAVSALTTTAVNALESVAGVKPCVTIGDARMIVSLTDGGNHDAQVILKALTQGLHDIASAYPNHLTVINR